MQSIFELEYIPSDIKTVESGAVSEAFLMLGEDSEGEFEALGMSSSEANKVREQGFVDLIIMNVHETHAEAYTLNNTLSDTVYAFSLGASPVNIAISAYALRTPEQDHFINFLKMYTEKFRGRALEHNKNVLYFGYKDTLMRLYINSIATVITADLETYVRIDIIGIASHYRVKQKTTAEISNQNSESNIENSYSGTVAERSAEDQRLMNSRAMARAAENQKAYSQERTAEELRLSNSRAMAKEVAMQKAKPSGGVVIAKNWGTSPTEVIEFEVKDNKVKEIKKTPITPDSATKLGTKIPVIDGSAYNKKPKEVPIVAASKPVTTSRTKAAVPTQTTVAKPVNPATKTGVNPGNYEVKQHVDSLGTRHNNLSHKHYHPNDPNRRTWTANDIPIASTPNPKDDITRNKVILQVKVNEYSNSQKIASGTNSNTKELDSVWDSALREKVEYKLYKDMLAQGYKF